MDSDGLGNRLPVLTLKFLRAFFPQSLRTRLILLILMTALLGQAATIYSVSRYQSNQTQTVALELVSTTIRTLQYSMEHVAPHDRAEFVQRASQGQWRLWSKPLPNEAHLQRRPPRRPGDGARQAMTNQPQRPVAVATSPPSAVGTQNPIVEGLVVPVKPEQNADDIRRSLGKFITRLNDELDGESRVALSRGPIPELYISLTRPVENLPARPREWLVIPIDRIDPPITLALIIWWASGLGLILLIALWFSWHITRPITRLVQATDQLAAGKPARVIPAGPTETRMLGERFNAMLNALSESDSTRRTLLAGLPHDLKAPLSRMWLRIEMTDDQALKLGMRTDLQDMQHMVDQFIPFLRGTDPATYHLKPFALNEWVEERVGNWQGAAAGAVMLIGVPEAVQVKADSVALSRLLDNLVSNALHHGAPPVHVSLTTQDQWAVLTVRDHGSGIAPEQRDKAMKPFVRLDEARTRTGNVGLGLALADAIARAHHGSLTLGQAAQGGLEVRVLLPVYDPGPDAANA